MDIKAYDNGTYSYSGTDEEYAEFLKSVDGKLNEGEPVEEDDLGNTKKINLQGVIEKFRKTADGIKDASKKLTAEAVSKFEDFKKSKEPDREQDNEQNREEVPGESFSKPNMTVETEHTESERPINADENVYYADLNDLTDKAAAILCESEKMSAKLEQIAASCCGITDISDSIVKKTEAVYTDTEEIRKAVSGINKLNDSIFDLKNAQLNSKKSLEELEKSFASLKKKCVWGVAIVSILTFISIALEIIILLS